MVRHGGRRRAPRLVLLFLTRPWPTFPKACLGAVIVAAAIGLVQPDDWRALAKAGRSQVVIAAVTFLGVVIFGVLQALIVAVALSIVDVVMRSAKPHDAVLGYVPRLQPVGRRVRCTPSAQVTPGVVVYRLDDRLLFANSRFMKGRIREAVAGAPREHDPLPRVRRRRLRRTRRFGGVEAMGQILDSLRPGATSRWWSPA